MDLFNSYRAPFLNEEDNVEEEDFDPGKTDDDDDDNGDEDDVLKDVPEEEASWDEQ